MKEILNLTSMLLTRNLEDQGVVSPLEIEAQVEKVYSALTTEANDIASVAFELGKITEEAGYTRALIHDPPYLIPALYQDLCMRGISVYFLDRDSALDAKVVEV